MNNSTYRSKTIIIIFGIGFVIYLIYIFTLESKDISEYRIDELLNQQDLHLYNDNPRYDILRVISKPSCGRFPFLVDLNVTDTYWQVTNTSNGTFYLFNAYYDDREGLKNMSIIRILGLINKIDPVVKTFCQLWFEDIKEAVISEIHEYRMLWPKYWGVNDKGASPYLISCTNPFYSRNLIPQYISIVENECDHANNILEIKNKRPKDGHKKHFLVSVKGIDFVDDVSLLLIEWFEILKLLGVDKVEVFVVNAHVNVIRVLQFYQSEKFVTIKYLKYPHELPNKVNESWHQWSQNDLVPYHDSFYENLYSYEFMVPLDIDEFIMPVKHEDRTWLDLVLRTINRFKEKHEEFDAFPVTNRYFLLKSIHENETIEGIPKKLRFLSNIYRAANFTPNGGNAKTFMRTDRVLAVHNHFPFSCIGPENCRWFIVNLDDGQLSHYRIDCDNPECKESKANPTKDITLWKYKDEILENVNETLKRLEKFKSNLNGEIIQLY